VTPHSRQKQTSPDTTSGATIASFAFLAASHHRQNLILIFPHSTKGALVQGVSLAIGPKVFLITFKVIDVI
jgi:hypothetical protein